MIGQLKADQDAKQLTDALAQLTEAIAKSQQLAEKDREVALGGIQALLQQTKAPPAERNIGLFKPIIDSIAGICGGAGGLITVWQAVGPAIVAFFGV
jgi:hypothetical protein